MKAIVTKYHGPTNTKPSRLSAKAEGCPRLFISYDHALTLDQCHRAAAMALCQKMNWTGTKPGELASGGLPDGRTCHVFIHQITHPLAAALRGLLDQSKAQPSPAGRRLANAQRWASEALTALANS